ncbi:ATPase [Chryseomicrobium excrementi]|uniref:ATPase n=1 Tax=Chryseomicrobium excrementi TaxID=2041346 RepID=A0A2M9EXS8_9BACL|nr:SRPBCC domain-containing protein [Chryseomicrobium excrementi]PJK16019.1 ATPase [Chryseomicrobium excrementi]
MEEFIPRIDKAARHIQASPERLFGACMDPEQFIKWLPPEGMTGVIEEFHPHEGGTFRIRLTYTVTDADYGKSGEHTDISTGRFIEIVPPERFVQTVVFQSDDPQYAGEMRQTWTFESQGDGTLVSVRSEHVPPGIRQEDHLIGMNSTLENLEKYVENKD